jgi:hypothetical protein
MRTLLILLASTICAFGDAVTMMDPAFTGQQVNSTPSAPSPPLNDVTNLAGYPPIAVYLPTVSGSYVSNTSPNRVTLLDLWTNSWNLTNLTAAHYPIQQSDGSIAFNASQSQSLLCSAFTNTLPAEYLLVVKLNGIATNAQDRYLFSSFSASARHYSYISTSGNALLGDNNAMTWATASTLVTNKIIVIDFAVGSTNVNIQCFTNNVQANVSGQNQTGQMQGLAIGTDHFLTEKYGSFQLYAMVVYGGGNPIPITNTVARGRVFASITNFIPLSP